MLEQLVTTIGVPGIIIILIFREVLNYKFRNKGNGENGHNNCVKRSEFDEHKRSVQYKDNCEQIVKRLDASINNQEKWYKHMMTEIGHVKTLIKNGNE